MKINFLHFSSIAPGIDNTLNVHNFLPLRIYHFIMSSLRKIINKIK